MLGSIFGKTKKNKETHFNPTALPDFVINQYCKISFFKHYGKGFTISDPGGFGDYVTYDRYLRSINLEPPTVDKVFEAARKNSLRLLFKESVDPDRKFPIWLKPDLDAIDKRFEFESKQKQADPSKILKRPFLNFVNYKRQNSGMKYRYEFY